MSGAPFSDAAAVMAGLPGLAQVRHTVFLPCGNFVTLQKIGGLPRRLELLRFDPIP
jgi:hypothetical protein